jgi:diacylglycerol kinase (CTP)
MIFWTFVAPLRPNNLSWEWNTGLSRSAFPSSDWIKSIKLNVGNDVTTSGWIGLGAIGVVAGIVAGVAEALGKS